jgi:hypothetical protein
LSATIGHGPARADHGARSEGPRWEDQQDRVATGPISIQHDSGNNIQVEHDAIYYLDYRGGRVLATVPSSRQSVNGTRMIDNFAERDLIADFKLTSYKTAPHFLMITGTVGNIKGAWAPLYVFETTTKQVATYQLTPLQVGMVSKPRFDLLEVRPLPPVAPSAGAQ